MKTTEIKTARTVNGTVEYHHEHRALESDVHETTVQGETYEYWSNYVERDTYALMVSDGSYAIIKDSGYLSNDLSVRKAIAASFGLDSFRR